MSRGEFEAYFFARDVIVGVGEERAGDGVEDGRVLEGTGGMNALLAAKGDSDRDWTEVVAGFYYVRRRFLRLSKALSND